MGPKVMERNQVVVAPEWFAAQMDLVPSVPLQVVCRMVDVIH